MSWTGNDDAAVTTRIATVVNSLQPSERRVVDHIIGDLDGVVEMTAQDLADRTGVARSTVIRTCQTLGYRVFPQLRVALTRELAQSGHPTEDFGQIYRSLGVGKEQRATGVELIESILREPLRGAVLGLVDDGPDELRITRAGSYHRVRPLDYLPLLEYLSTGESDAVSEVARYHAEELGLRPGTAQGVGAPL